MAKTRKNVAKKPDPSAAFKQKKIKVGKQLAAQPVMPSHDFDVDTLCKKAVYALANAYCPYTKLPVGAALLAEDGQVFTGGHSLLRKVRAPSATTGMYGRHCRILDHQTTVALLTDHYRPRYKVAETFGDTDAMKKILQAPTADVAQVAMNEIKGFDESVWYALKAAVWEEGQRLKLSQCRWILNLLVLSDTTYIAVASQDKYFGTGWLKDRKEANKPIFWDGENHGGNILMKIRAQLKENHAWAADEKEVTQKKFEGYRRFLWAHDSVAMRNAGAVPAGGHGAPSLRT